MSPHLNMQLKKIHQKKTRKDYDVAATAHEWCILGSMNSEGQTGRESAAPHGCSKLTQKHVDSTVATGVATEMVQLLHGYFGLISMHYWAILPPPSTSHISSLFPGMTTGRGLNVKYCHMGDLSWKLR